MTINWQDAELERYCVATGRAVNVPGDRCLNHSSSSVVCYTSFRKPRCEHPRVSDNRPYPRCEECGRVGEIVAEDSPDVG